MRVLITGGFGFVGGRVAQHLQQAGHTVVLGTRQATGSPEWLPEAQVAPILWYDPDALERACHVVDVIIHAAGMNAQDCAADPVAALEFNGVATARLVAAAVHAGVERFIYPSTAHVYASLLAGTITEETCPRNLHPYATSHLAGEHAVLEAATRGKTEGIVLRLSNAFGAPMHRKANCWMLLVNDLCRQAVETGQIVLKSSGLQQRDFVAMSEVCRVIGSLAASDTSALRWAIFNVGSGISQSVLEMAQLIQTRCAYVLGFEPALQLPEATAGECHEPLFYSGNRLTRAGIVVTQDPTAEIDRMLMFCNTQFRRLHEK